MRFNRRLFPSFVTKSLVAAGLLIASLSPGLMAQRSSGGFFNGLDMTFSSGINAFYGDFDPGSGAPVPGLFLPTGGYQFSLGFVKPTTWLRHHRNAVNIHFGLDYLHFKSATYASGLPVDPAQISGNLIPVNFYNTAIGPYAGLGIKLHLNDNTTFEPFLNLALYYQDPKTDGFVDADGNRVSSPVSRSGLSRGYSLKKVPETRSAGEADAVKSFLPAFDTGFRFGTVIGGFDWYLQYRFHGLLSNYFDNTSDASRTRVEMNSITGFSLGIKIPVGSRGSIGNPGSRDMAIRQLADYVQTDEDILALQEAMNGRIIPANAPGVRYNALAAKAQPRTVRLGSSAYTTDMVMLPGGSYVMGNNSVDELQIQPQGRKRVTINPFMMDKYQVSNREYRVFLKAMGISGMDRSDAVLDTLDTGRQLSWQELLTLAGLNLTDAQRAEVVNFPDLNGPGYLVPDSTRWQEMGLNSVVPWRIYFYDERYSNFPVVCVNWYQATLFAAWAGKRLPTESEWEYAARSGESGRVYPWDGLDLQDASGRYRANFMQERGVYDRDGYALMAPVDSYHPNDFGLYQMAGNVTEWVQDSYFPTYSVLEQAGSSSFVSPAYVNESEPRKVVRGGSWNATGFFLGVGIRNFQDKNLGTPMNGFRLARNIDFQYLESGNMNDTASGTGNVRSFSVGIKTDAGTDNDPDTGNKPDAGNNYDPGSGSDPAPESGQGSGTSSGN
ncbi:MAG: formylglycine-generating enzyme family protein [Cyclonatronaceae bacterium]